MQSKKFQNQKITVHVNEYDRMRDNRNKKPLSPDSINSTISTFDAKHDLTKRISLAEKRLKLAGLSYEILNAKYGDIKDSFIHLADMEGETLWCNKVGIDEIFGGRNPVGENARTRVLNSNQQNPEFVKQMKDMYTNLPKQQDFEFALSVEDKSDALWKIRYVGSDFGY